MSLNILHNFRVVYYNCLTNFYLCLNTIIPYYDDVIITLQKEAIVHLNINEEHIKKNRLLQFISDVCENTNKYRVIIDNEFKTIHFVEVEENCNDNDLENLDNEEDISDLDSSQHTDEEEKKTL